MRPPAPIPGSSRRCSRIFTELYGNAASVSHRFGWEAEEAVEPAREQVARAIGAEAREIVFTSAAPNRTTSPSKVLAQAAIQRGKHLVTAAAEHKAVLDPVKGWPARAGTSRSSTATSTGECLGRGRGRSPDRPDRPGLGHGGE